MRNYLPRLLLVFVLAGLIVSPRSVDAGALEARGAIQAVLDREAPRPVRGLETTARRYVETLREADGWALASIMPERPADVGDKLDAYLADVELALAWQEGGAWQVSFEADKTWQNAIQRAPFALLGVQSKKLISGWATSGTLSTRASSDWMFPWPIGETWIFTQGPHGAYNGALDFGNVAPAHATWVVAPADGVVIGACGTSQVVLRFDDGRALGFYHLVGRPANIYVGARVTRGTRLGHPGTNVDCGGSAFGPHLHLFAVAPGSIVGANFNGYTVTDDGWFTRDIKRGRLVSRSATIQICVVNPSRCAVRNDYRGAVAAPPAPAPAPATAPAPAPAAPRPAPAPVPAAPPPAAPVEPGIVVKDKDDANVERGGTPSTLISSGPSAVVASGHATWTSGSVRTPDNFVKWKPPLDRCGQWEVFAFIPYLANGRTDTTNAVYTIRSRAGTTPGGAETTRSVNVEAVNARLGRTQAERWESLGTYVWSAAANTVGEYVQLGDVTGEPGRRNVVFDDLRWVFRGEDNAACASGPASNEPDVTPPDGRLTNPANGAAFGASALRLAAEATDNPGGSGVLAVEFHVFYDGQDHLVSTDFAPPFETTWTPPEGFAAHETAVAIHVVDHAQNRAVEPGGRNSLIYEADVGRVTFEVRDRDDANVERGGSPSTLISAGQGAVVASGHATVTSSNVRTPDNFMKWKPPLDRCGLWEVFAFIPYLANGRADTTNAVYTIRSRAGTTPGGAETTRSVNVEAVNARLGHTQAERWESLGTYVWSAAANTVGEYVQLGDVTGEPSRRNVPFDDLRWVYRGAAADACGTAAGATQP